MCFVNLNLFQILSTNLYGCLIKFSRRCVPLFPADCTDYRRFFSSQLFFATISRVSSNFLVFYLFVSHLVVFLFPADCTDFRRFFSSIILCHEFHELVWVFLSLLSIRLSTGRLFLATDALIFLIRLICDNLCQKNFTPACHCEARGNLK